MTKLVVVLTFALGGDHTKRDESAAHDGVRT